MKVAIVGCGGIGGYLAASLIEAGQDVHLIARGNTLVTLRDSGLKLFSPLGNVDLATVKASADASTLTQADLIIICVKLWDTEDALKAIKPIVSSSTLILSFQNGVRAAETLAERFPRNQVLGAVCYISARIDSPATIVHTGSLKRFIVGELDSQKTPRLEAVASCFRSKRLDFECHGNINQAVWEKFVFLVGLSAATTGMRNSIGIIRANKQARRFVLGIMKEVTEVARSRSVELPQGFADRQLALMDELPFEMTASMYSDLQKHQRLELPWLSSDVARLGEESDVPTPMNAAVSDILSIYSLGGV